MGPKPVPFIEGHTYVLLKLHLAGEGAMPFPARRAEGHLDLERAREGGFAAGFFAVFVLPETEEERAATQIPDRKPPYALRLAGSIPTDYAIREAETMIDLLDELARSGEVCLARSAADVQVGLTAARSPRSSISRGPSRSSRSSGTLQSSTSAGCVHR